MSNAAAEQDSAIDLIAIALGLGMLCVGTVGAIGATGLTMWIFGL